MELYKNLEEMKCYLNTGYKCLGARKVLEEETSSSVLKPEAEQTLQIQHFQSQESSEVVPR